VRVSGAIAPGGEAYKDAVPYVLAYVELTEGPTMLTNIVGVDPDGVTIGLPVRVEFFRTGVLRTRRYPGFGRVTVEWLAG
jgi:uncharacterized OB-fold protein